MDEKEIYLNCTTKLPEIIKRVDDVIELTRKYSEFYEQRGTIEMESSKKMMINVENILLFGVQTNSKEAMNQPIQDVLNELENECETTAAISQKTGQMLINEVSQPLSNVLKEIETQKKQILLERAKKMKVYDDLNSYALRSEAFYLTHLRDTKDMKKKVEATPNDMKVIAKYNKLVISCHEAESKYQNAVEKVNTCRDMLYHIELVKVVQKLYELFSYHQVEFYKAIHRAFEILKTKQNRTNQSLEKSPQLLEDIQKSSDVIDYFKRIGETYKEMKFELKVERVEEIKIEEKEKSGWGFSSLVNKMNTSINEITQQSDKLFKSEVFTKPVFSFGKREEEIVEKKDTSDLNNKVDVINKENQSMTTEDGNESNDIKIVETNDKVDKEVHENGIEVKIQPIEKKHEECVEPTRASDVEHKEDNDVLDQNEDEDEEEEEESNAFI
ncbi:hypothetical protein EIN_063050 [Entamoeba invadens IP1]|uniref:hypothetical protein n=1 Tax=Entamoeba invadens IP1 TaxID=370355 RepID=UPI0002C3D812|nr:hypothetical protein EIN_063050 [Entamoeba invadens IP1]ELP93590.1 hypothetical protein EIN_063050 [Entamoeba invadens IP1]|eukprot:XP_004260361.1 hypothetical protein EIN_063050 [Entamoeba invadens IP1]